jgi:hypothetical protein
MHLRERRSPGGAGEFILIVVFLVIFGYCWLFLVIFGYFWLFLVIFVWAIRLTTCFFLFTAFTAAAAAGTRVAEKGTRGGERTRRGGCAFRGGACTGGVGGFRGR